MLETLGIVFLILIVVVLALLGYASTKPDTVRYARSAHINAPPEKILSLISDFKKWVIWSPWEKKDPALQRTYSGAANGVGAVYAWDGDKNVGSGRMEILESTPSKVRIKLDFFKPFKASNIAEFNCSSQGSTTQLDWVMTGQNLFIGKVMSIFIDMDKMIGKDFEAGLTDMKAAAES